MAFCSNCGTQLNDGANFCPKCGTPCNNNSIDSAKDSETAEDVDMEDSSKPKTLRNILFILIFIALIGGAWFGFNSLSDKGNEVNEQEKEVVEKPASTNEGSIEQTEVEEVSEEVDNSDDEKLEEFKEKVMECGNQIQQIMTEINNVYNRYVAASADLDDMNKQSMGVNAVADISDLSLKGDKIFKEMMNLASQYGQQEVMQMFKQEMDEFDRQANQMESAINQDIYN